MKTRIILIAIIGTISLGNSACSSLEPETVNMKGYTLPNVEHIFTAEELFPEGDVIPFVIIPMDGWTIGPGEIVFFKALLLDEGTGIYTDVTNHEKCKWNCAYLSGKMLNGDRPDLRNGQEITTYAVWDNKYPCQSTGHFVVPEGWEPRQDNNG